MQQWADFATVHSALDTLEISDPSRLAHLLRRHNVTRVLWSYSSNELPLLRSVSAAGIAIAPVVPNLVTYLREVTSVGGPVPAMLQRFRALSWPMRAQLLRGNAWHALSILRKDFATGIALLTEMELRMALSLSPQAVVLSANAVDLAVALNNRRVISALFTLVQRQFGLSVVIETANLGVVASKLIEWGFDVTSLRFLAPINASGYGMRPNQAECEQVCKSGRIQLIASDADADGTIAFEPAIEYLTSLNIKEYVLPSRYFKG